jgi:hypothetical protein
MIPEMRAPMRERAMREREAITGTLVEEPIEEKIKRNFEIRRLIKEIAQRNREKAVKLYGLEDSNIEFATR